MTTAAVGATVGLSIGPPAAASSVGSANRSALAVVVACGKGVVVGACVAVPVATRTTTGGSVDVAAGVGVSGLMAQAAATQANRARNG